MQASAKMTLQEQFTRTFDVFPFEPAEVPAHAQDFVRRSGSTTGSVYGFGVLVALYSIETCVEVSSACACGTGGPSRTAPDHSRPPR